MSVIELQSIGLQRLNPLLIINYQDEISITTTFSNPVTLSAVQVIIDNVNAGVALNKILAKVLEDSASPGGNSNADGVAVSLAELQALNISNLEVDLISDYQAAIQAETGFSNPALIEEIQVVIDATNQAIFTVLVLAEIGEDAAGNANGVLVTAGELGFLCLEAYPSFIIEYQAAITGGTYPFSSPATLAEVQTMLDGVNAAQQAIIPYVYNPATGAVWMDRNLGATQVATSVTDAAAYGNFYQWGRNSDGHELATSSNVAGPVVAGTEGSDFVTTGADWLTVPDGTRWNGTSKGTEDPCPSGYRIPTRDELQLEVEAIPGANNTTAFESILKLPATGFRNNSTGAIAGVGTRSHYWSSTKSVALRFTTGSSDISNFSAGLGFSVRCIKD